MKSKKNCSNRDLTPKAISTEILKDLSSVSLSIGVIGSDFWDEDETLIIKRADLAMYNAKQGGKFQSVTYSPEFEK